jgi:hypothetical protein
MLVLTAPNGQPNELVELLTTSQSPESCLIQSLLSDAAPPSFSPLSVPEIANNGSWWSPSRGISGVGTTVITAADQCANPANMVSDTANGVPTLMPLGDPAAFVGTVGFTSGCGAYTGAAAKLQPTTSLYVASWFAATFYSSALLPLVSQYNTTGTTGNKLFMLYTTTTGVAFRVRLQDDSANLVISVAQRVNEPHFWEGVYRNSQIELWRDRVLVANAAAPAQLPNLLLPTQIFNENNKGLNFNGKSGNIYLSTLVPSDPNRDLLARFEPLTYRRVRQLVVVVPPVLGAGALGTTSLVTGGLTPPFFIGADPPLASPLVAIPGGGSFLGIRPTALDTLEFQFLGPTNAVGTGFVLDRPGV